MAAAKPLFSQVQSYSLDHFKTQSILENVFLEIKKLPRAYIFVTFFESWNNNIIFNEQIRLSSNLHCNLCRFSVADQGKLSSNILKDSCKWGLSCKKTYYGKCSRKMILSARKTLWRSNSTMATKNSGFNLR